jgi:hypothetical protein
MIRSPFCVHAIESLFTVHFSYLLAEHSFANPAAGFESAWNEWVDLTGAKYLA